ncbi:MAG: D-alanine--D-alanine ligase [Nitrospirae bacterium]|nr:D-alanine--D-alanine ligase [Nitrospirota bacterium]
MLTTKKIGVLMGGHSSEREVSLRTAEAILKALREKGYEAVLIEADATVAERVRAEGIGVAFLAVHGKFGEDGCLQGLLEILGIPYTGSGVLASALGMDKIASRMLFLQAGLRVPPYRILTRGAVRPSHPFAYPVVVKPSREGSSVGVSIVRDPAALSAALDQAFTYDRRILVEQYIAGREIHVGILGDAALGAMEILPTGEFYDYRSKYEPGGSRHLFPAPLEPSLYARALETGLQAHRALGCRGYSRVDLLLDTAGQDYVLEVNTLPGMTDVSLLPEMARGRGIPFPDLVERILAEALREDTT